jgi:methionyl aminopeptidase
LITEKYGAHVDRTDLEGHDLSLHECFTFTRNHVFGLCDVDDQPLKTGEIIGMDVSIKKDGWAGDTSRVWIVGDETSPRLRSLLAVAYEAMWVGIRLVKPGVHLGTIAHEVQKYVENQGFSID